MSAATETTNSLVTTRLKESFRSLKLRSITNEFEKHHVTVFYKGVDAKQKSLIRDNLKLIIRDIHSYVIALKQSILN